MAVNSTKYSGCMRCFTGVCAALSPSTMPPFHITKAAKTRGTRIKAQRSTSRTHFRCHALSVANMSCCGSASGIGLSDLVLRQRFNTNICRLTLQGCKLKTDLTQAMPCCGHAMNAMRMPQCLLVSRIQINVWILTIHSSRWTDLGVACMTLTLHGPTDVICLNVKAGISHAMQCQRHALITLVCPRP